mgnify:CR=1 FL=1
MKKTLILLLATLLGVFLILSVLGKKGIYGEEKAIHKVSQRFMKVKEDPLATPEAEFIEVVEGFKSFLKK